VANEAKGKYSELATIRNSSPKPDAPPARREREVIAVPKPAIEMTTPGGIQLPIKTKPVGKRRDAAYRQKAVLLKTESVAKAERRLVEMQTDNDFSELMQALLDEWLATPA
jgi:hypothetical protein